jgi:hypothetical protein
MLSRMDLGLEFRLQSGRNVRLDQLHILPTITDWTDASNPKQMKKRLPDLVAKLIGTDQFPFIVKNEREGFLP